MAVGGGAGAGRHNMVGARVSVGVGRRGRSSPCAAQSKGRRHAEFKNVGSAAPLPPAPHLFPLAHTAQCRQLRLLRLSLLPATAPADTAASAATTRRRSRNFGPAVARFSEFAGAVRFHVGPTAGADLLLLRVNEMQQRPAVWHNEWPAAAHWFRHSVRDASGLNGMHCWECKWALEATGPQSCRGRSANVTVSSSPCSSFHLNRTLDSFPPACTWPSLRLTSRCEQASSSGPVWQLRHAVAAPGGVVS